VFRNFDSIYSYNAAGLSRTERRELQGLLILRDTTSRVLDFDQRIRTICRPE